MSSILSDVKKVLDDLKIPNETAKFSGETPDYYAVLTPLGSDFEYSDNLPTDDIQEVRISLFIKGNYLGYTSMVSKALIKADLTITSRKFVGYEDETSYYHYAIDVENNYEFKTEE